MTLQCCEKGAEYIGYYSDWLGGDKEFKWRTTFAGTWDMTHGEIVSYCPFCGTRVPDVKPEPSPAPPQS